MIRRAHAGDIWQVGSLYHTVWHETQARFMPAAECTNRSMEFFIERMTPLLPTTLVVERKGAVVAFSAWRGQRLGQIFVAEAHRGSGIASSLLRASEVEMANEGTSEAELHCAVGNQRARRFYERMGWLHRGEIMEQVTSEDGQVDVPFWRMTKFLVI
jgi:ribosomal protein S18 acetylase RimI-like enzyme